MEALARTNSADGGLLGLESVLVGSLSTALMTADAPDRCSVEAVREDAADRSQIDDWIDEGGNGR